MATTDRAKNISYIEGHIKYVDRKGLIHILHMIRSCVSSTALKTKDDNTYVLYSVMDDELISKICKIVEEEFTKVQHV
jgi:hypothetical protein